MALQKKNENLSYDGRSNFGVKGWWIIIFAALNWWMFSNMGSASLNVVIPQFAAKLGVDQAVLLTWTTPAGIVAVICSLVIGWAARKWGVKTTNIILLVLSALSTVLWAVSGTVVGYVIGIMLVFAFTSGTSMVAGNMGVTNWFPKKKGIALGWATMGLNISGAMIVPILNALTGIFGDIKYALFCEAGVYVILTIINIFAFKNYPEEWNAYPDNDPSAQRRKAAELQTGWTIGKVLKQKETWKMAFATGVFQMTTLGFVSTLVASMVGKGFAPPEAIQMMTIACVLGLAGSYLCGLLDQKMGTQKASIIYALWVAVGILFFFFNNKVCAWIYLIMMGLSIGGSNNYPPSMTAQIFGRDGSQIAFPIIFFIKGIFAYLVYAILGQSLAITGSYNVGWIIIMVLAVLSAIVLYCTNLDPKKDPKEE